MENIRYGRPEATDEEVRGGRRCGGDGFLERLPNGFSTFLGEKGVRLSGGEASEDSGSTRYFA